MTIQHEGLPMLEEVRILIDRLYRLADPLLIGNPTKLELCEIAFQLHGIKGQIINGESELKAKIKYHVEVRAGETVYAVWRRELLEMLN